MRVDQLPDSYSAKTGTKRVLPRRLVFAPAGLLLLAFASAAIPICFSQDTRPLGTPTPVSSTAETKPPSDVATKPSKLQKAEALDSARRKQISDESTQLLAMALALKAEVDKTNKDTLSLKVIRKADEIERLAKTVKENIKSGSGGS